MWRAGAACHGGAPRPPLCCCAEGSWAAGPQELFCLAIGVARHQAAPFSHDITCASDLFHCRCFLLNMRAAPNLLQLLMKRLPTCEAASKHALPSARLAAPERHQRSGPWLAVQALAAAPLHRADSLLCRVYGQRARCVVSATASRQQLWEPAQRCILGK